MGILYLVSTPIGNLEDITLRALRILKEVAVIAAEDTRTTRKLLNHYDIRNRLISYHQFSRPDRVRSLLHTLEEGDVALVSEAGTPCLSDPGYPLVRAALAHGVTISPVPGPSAITAALALSGLPADQFLFLGFLPRRPRARQRVFESLADEERTAVALEAPHRIRKTLEDMASLLPDRPLVVCRELTKHYEEVFRGKPEEALAHFTEPRGEFTLVLGGCGLTAHAPWDAQQLSGSNALVGASGSG